MMRRCGFWILLAVLLIGQQAWAAGPAAQLSQQAFTVQKQGFAATQKQDWSLAITYFHKAVTLEAGISGNAEIRAWLELTNELESKAVLHDMQGFIQSLKLREFDTVDDALRRASETCSMAIQRVRREQIKWQSWNLSGQAGQVTETLRSALFNLALAQDKAGGRTLLTMVWYHAYLATQPDAQNVALVSNRIKELQSKFDATIRMLSKKAKTVADYNRSIKVQLSSIRQAPGSSFQDMLNDGSLGPEMVILPAGTYTMGYIHGKGVGLNKNRPFMVHSVEIPKPFAIGKYEVTVQEYKRFAQATGRRMPLNQGGELHPVSAVSWKDAAEYANWLSNESGEKYRLPSEAEWEYAARAGTETKFWWGNDPDHEYANFGAGFAGPTPFPAGVVHGRDQWQYTSPVGSFPANTFGVHDTSGNVWEYVADCFRHNYKKVPPGAGAYEKKKCGAYTMRGGSWGYNGNFIRSASRAKVFWEVKLFLRVGFRMAKDME
jgi:formylglycine-generating enzyme required for sulfatase activity